MFIFNSIVADIFDGSTPCGGGHGVINLPSSSQFPFYAGAITCQFQGPSSLRFLISGISVKYGVRL